VALGVCENTGHKPPDTPADFDWNRQRLQVYLLGPEYPEPHPVTTLIGDTRAYCRTMMPSDDGAYVALAGWHNGLLMVDAKASREMWRMKPPKEAGLSYVDFAPDNRVVYTGGIKGCVYTVDVQTGKVLSEWQASPTGRYEYRHEIECLAVSPDGRWVAVGTGPEGLVFVGSTSAGKLVQIFKHGGRTVELVQFSPDSKALASWDRSTIKIWNVSRWDSAASATTQPGSAPASGPSAETSSPPKSGLGRS
jgi:WD40 repeat protein